VLEDIQSELYLQEEDTGHSVQEGLVLLAVHQKIMHLEFVDVIS